MEEANASSLTFQHETIYLPILKTFVPQFGQLPFFWPSVLELDSLLVRHRYLFLALHAICLSHFKTSLGRILIAI